MTTIGQNIRRYRKAFGLSQVELARAVGIAQPNLSALETDKHDPHAATLRRVAEALGVPVAALFDETPRTDGPPPPPRTPRTDEDGATFDARFAATDEAGAVALRREIEPEFDALQGYVKALKVAGIGDENFLLRRARWKLRMAQERLYALNFRENDLAIEGRVPKDTVAEYIPSNRETEELARLIIGDTSRAKDEAG